ncbi:hypothetical protein B0H11DRAFT_978733 [Mycena galericulata]|nr:hypothetical protein B0H11DRAFT_978733 [Mycena galericulata]
MTSRATDNLRAYFRKAVLPVMHRSPATPDMPLAGRRSHHVNVQVVSQPWRQLVEIRDLGAAWDVSLHEMVTYWADDKIPTQSLGTEDSDNETGDRFTVSCDPTFDIPAHSGWRPTDIIRMIPWLDYLPLMTVQRLLHLLFPQHTSGWSFSLADDTENADRKVFQHFTWCYSGSGSRPSAFTPLGDIPRYPVVIAFQPPWVLSEKDILEFSEARLFPRFGINHGGSGALTGAERLWANVWDTCIASKTRWFVLTSYNQWVFGLFSEGWTIGFVSGVYQFDARNPTVLEILAFWVACAMRLPGWKGLPKVRESVTAGPPRIPPRASGTSDRGS